jgi:molybdopterin-containing oxidoreductase family iron-sulfur binding subunit
MGRPTKLEGNPDHPASLGATDAFAQASILSLYDPDRSQTVTYLGQISTWEMFLEDLRGLLDGLRQRYGRGLVLLTEAVTSPTLDRQMRLLMERFPQARWHIHEPVDLSNVLEGARLAFGRAVQAVHRFERARVVLSLDADFLSCGPAAVRYARDFMSRRELSGDATTGRRESAQNNQGSSEADSISLASENPGNTGMNRLYVVESTHTPTGAAADHRLALKAGEIGRFAVALAAELGVAGVGRPESAADAADAANEKLVRWIRAVVEDLQASEGDSIIIAGDNQPPAIHALAHAMNARLGNVGNTLYYIEPVELRPEASGQFRLARSSPTGPLEYRLQPTDSGNRLKPGLQRGAGLAALAEDLAAGNVELLVIVGGNPVYTSPADLAVCGEARACQSRRAFEPVSRRDLRAVPLAHPAGA